MAARGTERLDFQATSDPALLASADRGESHLLTYEQLYGLWERQQWATQEIDFTQDRVDWHERFDEQERFERMYGLSAFFVGEQRVAAELGPMMRAAPEEPMRLFLCTQIADEARSAGAGGGACRAAGPRGGGGPAGGEGGGPGGGGGGRTHPPMGPGRPPAST